MWITDMHQIAFDFSQQPKPELQKGPQHRLDYNLAMDLSTTYHRDYAYRVS